MWVLEHESLFGGKRVWLRPGTAQLFGRTRSKSKKDTEEGKQFQIHNPNVSRQHMMLKVHEVAEGAGTKLHARSRVEIMDLSCKGTTIDENTRVVSTKEKQESTFLTGTEHSIRLVLSYPPFKIKWEPTVLTFASKDKDFKNSTPALHALDIKTTDDFVFGQTTHVVSKKRNLGKVLTGLTQAVHIVSGDYLKEIFSVTTPQNADPEAYIPSRLEEDFDEWWPKENKHIPPPGGEPTPRPAELLEPDPARSEVFSGLTFIYLERKQYDSLAEPVGGGGGKVLLYEVVPNETTVDDFVEYVRNTAGQKRSSKVAKGRLPVITVRPTSIPADWGVDFVDGVEQALNQRCIQQNEILDAVLMKDAGQLQGPPTEVIASSMPSTSQPTRSMRESTPPSQRPQKTVISQAPEEDPGSEEELTKPITRKRPLRRPKTTATFTGFDDWEPPSKVRKIEPDTPMDDMQDSVPHIETQGRSLSGTQTQAEPSLSIRRHPSPPSSPIEEKIDQDQLFPAAAAYSTKRRELAEREASASVDPHTSASTRKPRSQGAQILEKIHNAQKKAYKEVDVREQTRLRMQELEEARLADEARLAEHLSGIDISAIRDNVQILEMEIKPRDRNPRSGQHGTAHDQRWDPSWNGRKNFKKFKRKGVDGGIQPQKVIVALEPAATKKSFGIVDAMMLEEDDAPRSKAEQRRLERRTGRADEGEQEGERGFSRKRRKEREQEREREREREKEREVVVVEDSGEEDERGGDGEEDVPGSTDRVVETQIGARETQTQTQNGRKRGAVSVAVGAPRGKRSRIGLARGDDENSDAEETGFRMRKRR